MKIAPLLAMILMALPLGGCHALLLFPCLLKCSTFATSLPPRNDPLAQALRQGVDVNRIDAALTTVARAQFEALGRHWPQSPDCQQMAAVGCHYSIAVKVDRLVIMAVEPRGCGTMDVVVEGSADGMPLVRRTNYRDKECPADTFRE